MGGRSRDPQTKGTEVSSSLQRSPGRAGVSAALKAWEGAPSLHTWTQLVRTLGTLLLHGMGQDLLPASSDVGCCNLNCGRRVTDFPVCLSQIIPWKRSSKRSQPLDMALQEKQAGIDGGLWGQPAVPGAMHPARGSLLEFQRADAPDLPLVFCPGHSQPHQVLCPLLLLRFGRVSSFPPRCTSGAAVSHGSLSSNSLAK